ncbi:iron-sulfur cluster repair protein YtfE [Striga asiatica]|uniref:Iron-sulfur cluster repair protein YtfE n=1 Tax=Striga asiatica TaxID=4170 RepID=A0A5A7R126_STRAF|nr:iron-sulfur cluster repair protein YtfE [Striga asiatica]
MEQPSTLPDPPSPRSQSNIAEYPLPQLHLPRPSSSVIPADLTSLILAEVSKAIQNLLPEVQSSTLEEGEIPTIVTEAPVDGTIAAKIVAGARTDISGQGQSSQVRVSRTSDVKPPRGGCSFFFWADLPIPNRASEIITRLHTENKILESGDEILGKRKILAEALLEDFMIPSSYLGWHATELMSQIFGHLQQVQMTLSSTSGLLYVKGLPGFLPSIERDIDYERLDTTYSKPFRLPVWNNYKLVKTPSLLILQLHQWNHPHKPHYLLQWNHPHKPHYLLQDQHFHGTESSSSPSEESLPSLSTF